MDSDVVDGSLRAGVRVLALVAFVRDSQEFTAAFLQRVTADPAVVQCHALSGEYDYAMVVHSPDLQSFTWWAEAALLADGNVLRYSGFVIAATIKGAAASG